MKKALCVLLSVVMLLSMSVTAFAADTKGAPSQTLPSWLPDDAPAPDPNSEISIVHFYINEDGETIVYDPETEVILIQQHTVMQEQQPFIGLTVHKFIGALLLIPKDL